MDRQFRKTEIFTVLLMLSFSSLLVVCPTGKSAFVDPIYECTPTITLEYNETILQQPIAPYAQPKEIPLTINLSITGSEAADIVLNKIGGKLLIVHLSITEVSEGCHASINPPLIEFEVPSTPGEVVSDNNASLSLTIDQYLPAFSKKNVKVNMYSESLGKTELVKAGYFNQTVTFEVGYYPQISFSYPDGNVKTISPGQIANFPIDLQNFGNFETVVNSEVADIPEGWQASIVKSITLESDIAGNNLKETLSLNVKPPINFGYHEDRAVIKVKMTPVCYNYSNYTGEPYYLYFIVQSKGFSATPGFEIGPMLLAFIIVMFFVWRRKSNSIEKKQSRRKKE